VWRTESGDWPYNDLEFYVFLRGSLWLNERRHQASLQALAKRLSTAAGVCGAGVPPASPTGVPPVEGFEICGGTPPKSAGETPALLLVNRPAPRLDVEFKISSLAKLRRSRVTMFSYDLAEGHRWLLGSRGAGIPPASLGAEERLLAACEHHRDATRIPLAEATRLLMNRCSGLLFALERLQKTHFTPEDADFVGRNLAKAQLAFGDAVLTTYGQYHWSCRERQRLFQQLCVGEDLPWLAEVRDHHAAGVAFKLHPQPTSASRASLQGRHAELTTLALQLWLWLESHRLKHPFVSARAYALSPLNKCPETKSWRNLLINLRTFGPASLLSIGFPKAARCPRERIFHALALLLWEPESLCAGASRREIQNELRTTVTGFVDLLTAYQRLWGRFH